VRLSFENKRYRYDCNGKRLAKKDILCVPQDGCVVITAVQKLIIFSVWWYLLEPIFALVVFLGAGLDANKGDADCETISQTAREIASQTTLTIKIFFDTKALLNNAQYVRNIAICIDKKGGVSVSKEVLIDTTTQVDINPKALKRWKNIWPRVILQGLLMFVVVALLVGFLA